MSKTRRISQGRRVVSFFLISGITLGIVLVASSNTQTLEALRLIGMREIFYLVVLTAFMFVFDALRTVVLSRALVGDGIPFFYALKVMFIGRFFGAITPLQSGMLPAEMYMINKYGLPLGKAISIDVIKRFSTMGVLAIGGILVLFLDKDLSSNKVMVYVYYYVVFFYLLCTALFFFVYFFPKQTHWMIDRVMVFLHNRGVVKNYEIDEYVHEVAHDYSFALDFYMHKGLKGFLLSLCVTMIFIVIQFVMAPVIILGLGYSASFMEAFEAQVILMPMLYFAPTPGGSGIAEGGFALLFSGFIPKHLIGITVVLWRIFITFIGVAIGGLLTIGSIDPEKVFSRSSKKG